MHVNERSLLQAPAQRAPQRCPRRIVERVIIASKRLRQIIDRVGEFRVYTIQFGIIVVE
jgi:hypothetical protein